MRLPLSLAACLAVLIALAVSAQHHAPHPLLRGGDDDLLAVEEDDLPPRDEVVETFPFATTTTTRAADITNLGRRPVIGILTQPVSPLEPEKTSYIAASYVKFAEAAGARVVPVHFKSSPQELERTLDMLNGFLMPGGGMSVDAYSKTNAQFLEASFGVMEYAERANARGERFPVFATCLGMEILVQYFTNLTALPDSGRFNHAGVPDTITFVNGNVFEGDPSWSLDELSRDVVRAVEKNKASFFSHSFGLTPQVARRDKRLSSVFHTLAESQDLDRRPFVAMTEGRPRARRPYILVQFHPEKVLFEMTSRFAIPHLEEGLEFSSYLARRFGRELRGSRRVKGEGEEEYEAAVFSKMIQNTCPIFQGDSYFEESFVFN